MSQSSQPLTFGVEFEVVLAYADPTEIQPDYYSETRTVEFETIEADFWHPYPEGHRTGRNNISVATRNAVFRHIQSTMENAGYAVRLDSERPDESFNEWCLTNDSSINKPEYFPHYLDFLDLELVSPAYYFVPDALKAIEDVLALLKSTYLMNVNPTTGFHVHCGDSLNGFKFDTLRKLVSFLFAFTPQLNTIHPSNRQDVTDTTYAGSLRENSRFETKRRLPHKARPSPIQAVSRFINSETETELLSDAGNAHVYMAYDFVSIQQMASGDSEQAYDFKPTVEFRQHEGCLDADEAINWIKTVVGIVDFCMNAPTTAVHRLLLLTKLETWEKLGDGHDAEREDQLGPIPADKHFTAIHLLQALNLPGPALHYAQRGLHKHKMKGRTESESNEIGSRKWEYEKTPLRDPAVQTRTAKLREAWHALRAASRARDLLDAPVRAPWTFDPTDPLWPAHDASLDDGADTDGTTDDGSNYSPRSSGAFSTRSGGRDGHAASLSGNREHAGWENIAGRHTTGFLHVEGVTSSDCYQGPPSPASSSSSSSSTRYSFARELAPGPRRTHRTPSPPPTPPKSKSGDIDGEGDGDGDGVERMSRQRRDRSRSVSPGTRI